MSAFDHQPAPYLAAEEQQRGDNLAAYIVAAASNPASATRNSLPLYQLAARAAYENAARHTEQPPAATP